MVKLKAKYPVKVSRGKPQFRYNAENKGDVIEAPEAHVEYILATGAFELVESEEIAEEAETIEEEE